MTAATLPFGNTPQGKANIYILKNKNGLTVKATNFGAIITAIEVPDKNGKFIDIVQGFDNIEQYLQKHPHFGGLIGRYGNRIAGGSFTIDGKKYQLQKNNGNNNLHGGPIGFDKMLHIGETFETEDTVGVIFSRTSPHLEMGFPGELHYKTYYTLTNDNELIITYEATTDKTTHVNLTNHSYFNLDGESSADLLNHELTIMADYITEFNTELLTTGNLYEVAGTPFDFRSPKSIGQDIDDDNEQIKFANGYDHNFVLNNSIHSLELAAIARSSKTGIVMEVHTTEPGVQLYTSNNLNCPQKGKSGKVYQSRSSFCLETQHYPDSPNNAEFPPTLLKPGELYESQTVFKFYTD